MSSKLLLYVEQNPYPEYCLIEELLLKHDRWELLSEYGQINHILCKKIYENPNDENIIVSCGKQIYKRGGFTALQANYYVIIQFYKKSRDEDIRYCYPKKLEFTFEKITSEWKA